MGFLKRLFGTPVVHTEVEIAHGKVEPQVNLKNLYKKTCPKMNVYKIRGRNRATGRIRTVRKVALASSSQEEVVASCSLYDIQSFEVDMEPPTEAQLNYAKDLGVAVSDNYSKNDVSCLITRASSDDGRDDMIPVDINLAKMLADRDVCLSEFSGEKRALDLLWTQLSEGEKIRFFIFCIHQNCLRKQDYDLENSPYLDLYNDFINKYRDNQQFKKSLAGYIGSDLSLHKEPNRRRNAYKIASEYFLNN